MIIHQIEDVVADGLTLPECPRWYDNHLYFSDILKGRIYRLGGSGKTELLWELTGSRVGGIGFLPGGDLIAVLQKQRQVVRLVADEQFPFTDLVPLTRFGLNDMIVANGSAYVSQPGFDLFGDGFAGEHGPTEILRVGPDGAATVAARDISGPNGLAIDPAGVTLYVAESGAGLISTFSIAEDGCISSKQIFAQLPAGSVPDGICLDDGGGVWAASPLASSSFASGVFRLEEGGKITDFVPVAEDRSALACVLGGPDRNLFYVCTVPRYHDSGSVLEGAGRVEVATVPYRGAGWP